MNAPLLLPTEIGAAEIAEILGVTKRTVERMAHRDRWQGIDRPVRGGQRRMYPLLSLPMTVRQAVIERSIPPAVIGADLCPAARPADAPNATAVVQSPAALKDWQRRTLEARAAIVGYVKTLAASAGAEAAVRTVLKRAAEGTLPEPYQSLVPVANARAGESGARTLSRSTLYRWLDQSKRSTAALAPASCERLEVPAWAAPLLAIYQRPQKPSLAWAMEMLATALPEGVAMPSYGQARRFLDRMHVVEREKGRMGPREIKTIKPFMRRTTGQLWPADVYTADGHTFDAEVAHPRHGRPFRPEITTVLDVATRRVVGWSAGLAETTWGVLDALRHACIGTGIPALFYVDNGSGFRNVLMDGDVTGFLARLHVTGTHSLPYNSQARGLEERSHQSIWVRGAKTLPTYMGGAMDREARQRAYKITRADIAAVGASRLLMPWADFLTWCQVQIDAYHARPHKGLPMTRDAVTGKRRHQTPTEAHAAALTEGWTAVPVEPAERDDLFRPYAIAVVRRGEVSLHGNRYFSRDLEGHHGEKVRVGYDIHDASRAWIRDLQGRLVCVAEFEANSREYFPRSVVEQAAEKRAQGRIARAQIRIDEAEAELRPTAQIEHAPTEALDLISAELQRLPEPMPVALAARPIFVTPSARYRWLMAHRDAWTPADHAWSAEYVGSDNYADLQELFDAEGIAWPGVDPDQPEEVRSA